jgi:carbamoyl-phosphate synthase large subunit
MSRRSDLEHILVIGSGPIVIGQACEFDYSGTQACRVLRAEGFRISLVNSNPATIMTDPEFADATYIEPLTPEFVEQVIAAERPDALLATLGGQTALNIAVALHERGVLARYGVELIGADIEAIRRGEDRQRFKDIVASVGAQTPRSAVCHSLAEVLSAVAGEPAAGEPAAGDLPARPGLGYPVVVRPSFTMGGAGSGMAHDEEQLRRIASAGLAASPVQEVLIEESVLGWKEYELELMRDRHDNVVVVCSIENVDPMGVHTGDSVTVAPAMTLTDREYQHMRDVGIAVLRAVGVDTGGCNIQFAVDPATGRMVVIEMNPRVSRSSALASKATGFPIAKIAARLAVGYTLDEIVNDITGATPASFEPALDYVVVKVPRFAFEKFPGADPELTTHMKSVGEAMAIGRNFTEALGKAMRSMETPAAGFWTQPDDALDLDLDLHLDSGQYRSTSNSDRLESGQYRSISNSGGRSFDGDQYRSVPNKTDLDVGQYRSKSSNANLDDDKYRSPSSHGAHLDDGEYRPVSSQADRDAAVLAAVLERLRRPTDGRLYDVERALRLGGTVDQVAQASGIDPWFVDQVALVLQVGAAVRDAPALTPDLLRLAKRHGLSDRQVAALRPELAGEDGVRALRHRLGIRPVYKTVDTCAAEFAASTPYHYSSYDEETEVAPRTVPAVIILGSGPNRIGQGIEFDYSCVHAAMALRAAPDNAGAGWCTVMVNCNPETVSTDYDTSDRLYFEPLTLEDVLEVVQAERAAGPVAGVVVQLGGQTPLGLAQRLKDAGVPVLGTQPEAIHLAEDRGAFGRVLARAGLPAPRHGTATSFEQARAIADEIGYPVLVRPSYVLGGRGMEIVYDEGMLAGYIDKATAVSPEHPVLVDRFLDDAIEIDVDALFDGEHLYLGGIMEHIEEAGIHSGDSACALPPITLGAADVALVRQSTEAIARGVGVRGLLNVQYALKDDVLWVLEANPRASRTVPFVSKATAVPLAKAAARIAVGATVPDLRAEGLLPATGDGGDLPVDAPIAVKEAVLPFHRFRTADGRVVDSLLGPEMKSTGEVMGVDDHFGIAFAKSQAAAYGTLPTKGRVFVSIANRDKRAVVFGVKRLADLGFEILATEGTALMLRRHGVLAQPVGKFSEHLPGNVVERIRGGEVDLVFNTPAGSPGNSGPRLDGYEIRNAAVAAGIPCITTVQAMAACVQGIEALRRGEVRVRPLQDMHAALRAHRQDAR